MNWLLPLTCLSSCDLPPVLAMAQVLTLGFAKRQGEWRNRGARGRLALRTCVQGLPLLSLGICLLMAPRKHQQLPTEQRRLPHCLHGGIHRKRWYHMGEFAKTVQASPIEI